MEKIDQKWRKLMKIEKIDFQKWRKLIKNGENFEKT